MAGRLPWARSPAASSRPEGTDGGRSIFHFRRGSGALDTGAGLGPRHHPRARHRRAAGHGAGRDLHQRGDAQLCAKASGRSRLPRHFRRADDGPADGLHDRHLRPHSGPRALTAIPSLAIEAWLVQMIFAMARIGATLVSAPIFSALGVPLQVRVILAGAVGVLVLGLYPLEVPADPLSLQGFATIAQEALIGLSVGFILQVAFAAPLLAGEYLSNSIGLGFANMVDPQSGGHSAVVGPVLMILMHLLFLAVNGPLVPVENRKSVV